MNLSGPSDSLPFARETGAGKPGAKHMFPWDNYHMVEKLRVAPWLHIECG